MCMVSTPGQLFLVVHAMLRWWLQARAHNLLRQKDADLSTAKQSATEQFQADVAAAEAATVAAQQQLEQVLQPAPSFRRSVMWA